MACGEKSGEREVCERDREEEDQCHTASTENQGSEKDCSGIKAL